ncbi:MAG: hypothetical protein E6H94_08365 [Chloroflexi bacterium]|nr:MAG: hypothetical protein E6H94_08365 [Chloroflexota bacterium]
MTSLPRTPIVRDVASADPIQLFVLQEFRLRAADPDGVVARIVAARSSGREPAVPLLTSIGDRRDVATIRAFHAGEPAETDAAQRAALDPLVSSWASPKHYAARISERSQSSPSHFRLAVTESGINVEDEAFAVSGPGPTADGPTSTPVGLVWIGAPVGTYAGLLVLVGSYDDPDGARQADGWPLPLSRELGVRIYESNKG